MGLLKEYLYLPPRLVLWETSTKLTPEGNLGWQPMGIGDIWTVSPDQQTKFDKRLDQMEETLFSVQRKIRTHDQEKGKDLEYDGLATRMLGKLLFPCLVDKIIKTGREKILFHGLPMQDYINYVAFSEALGLREWIVHEHLPPDPKYQQELEFVHIVGNSNSVLDLVRLISAGTTTIDDSGGPVYSRQVNQQVISTLGLTELIAVTDLARDPQEEKLLKEFGDQTSDAFPKEEEIRLILGLNDDASRVLFCHIGRKGDNMLQTALAQTRDSKKCQLLNHGYRVRFFGSQLDYFAIFHPREKKLYSEALKILRGRTIPVEDAHAARFIVSDKKYLVKKNGEVEQEGLFILTLRQKLGKDWVLEKEFEETRTPSSKLPYSQIKYHAWKRGEPNVRMEVVFEWLFDNGLILNESSWIPYRYLKDINWEALRVRQLLEGPLQHIFPKEYCGIDWDSPEIQKELFDYANNKAIYPLVI